MPQRKTAQKELRKNQTRREKNLVLTQRIKTSIKNLKKAIPTQDSTNIQTALNQTYSILDKASAKNLYHRNKVARKKSRITKLVTKLSKTQANTPKA